ncbi:hypothetical protein Ahy_A08g037685 isoform B [Arachis hypogaea]|uniref:Uncharacterized protein n=1 Tax=Arachis hypogaea TaxID=3818 RepID=A0A445BRK4_ARAHY|nr:hypothetical protein Ahy_A08g037685 isoform B [Arachis hypogaea]
MVSPYDASSSVISESFKFEEIKKHLGAYCGKPLYKTVAQSLGLDRVGMLFKLFQLIQKVGLIVVKLPHNLFEYFKLAISALQTYISNLSSVFYLIV